MTTPFFCRDDDWYVGNDPARGPWSPDSCHAGPVTAVIAGATEAIITDRQLVRLTVNYLRPVAMSGFRVEARAEGSGRTAASTSVAIFDRDDKLLATARCLHLAVHEIPEPPTTERLPPPLASAHHDGFPVRKVVHDQPFFGSEVEIAYPEGQDHTPGPTTIWMKCRPIVAGETSSPFQSACPLSDCASGFARNAEFVDVSCVNPDLTVLLHRLPRSEWLASSGESYWEPSGIGSSAATLYDEHGLIGSALQSLVIRPVTD
jgi:hypothetical protein